MKLTYLLEKLEYEVIQGNDQIEITELTNDSRKVIDGSVFVCISGAVWDGHAYVKDVAEKGAIAVVCEDAIDLPVTQIFVENSRKAMSYLSACFFGYPSKKLKTIGTFSFVISLCSTIKTNSGVA